MSTNAFNTDLDFGDFFPPYQVIFADHIQFVAVTPLKTFREITDLSFVYSFVSFQPFSKVLDVLDSLQLLSLSYLLGIEFVANVTHSALVCSL